MKFIETAILSESESLTKQLISTVFTPVGTIKGVPGYRFGIDTESIAMAFDLSAVDDSAEHLIDHLVPHLSKTLLIVDRLSENVSAQQREKIENLCHQLAEIPTIVALACPQSYFDSLKQTASEGLYLSDNGRIVFWHPENKESIYRVWENLFLKSYIVG
jgi:hypothetical protein